MKSQNLLLYSLEEHVVIGNILKLLKHNLSSLYTEMANEYGKTDTTTKKFKKSLEAVNTLKDVLDDVMFHDHPEASDDYLKAYYNKAFDRLPNDLNKLKTLKGWE